MKTLVAFLSCFILIMSLFGQNIEHRLGNAGIFVVEDSGGIPLVSLNEDGELSAVGRTTRLITENEVALGGIYLEVIDKAQSTSDLNLEFTAEPAVGTERLIVIKDMKGKDLYLNLLLNVLSHQWISSDASFKAGDGSTVASINDLNGGTGNQIVYGSNVTPPGTQIRIVYLGNGIWTSSTSFLSTYSP